MPNIVDEDRISASLQNSNVVDMTAYRAAAAERKTAAPYFNPQSLTIWTIAIIVFVLLFTFGRR